MIEDASSAAATSQLPTVIQAGFLDLLPRFLGLTLLLMLWLVLQALGWVAEAVFHTSIPTILAAIFGLALLPHWLSVLVALVFPARRRLVVDENGLSFRLGMSVYAANWAQIDAITQAKSPFGRPALRARGGLRIRSWLWAALEWPLLLAAWLAMVCLAVLIDSIAASAIDFPSRDTYTIPRLFTRGQNLGLLQASLGPRLQRS